MGMMKEFKDFAMKGNLVDIAVAFVMGGAFGKVVTSFTEGLVAPLVGMLTGNDLSKNVFVLKKGIAAQTEIKDTAGNIVQNAVDAQAEVALKWGAFITAVVDFVIVAFVMFLVIKAINSMKKKEEAAPAAPAEDVVLLREIRDALKK
ncbi:MAG: large conductance mechanosensitive channel protein MscL [Bacteroidetes bacterium]|nr:large conductance mechanosensitive channel protein MscL [Bacteroidota bacterium]